VGEAAPDVAAEEEAGESDAPTSLATNGADDAEDQEPA
jgi:hypothetical protein